jgi:hypothetical protein
MEPKLGLLPTLVLCAIDEYTNGWCGSKLKLHIKQL